jgi:hypothetical protein
MNRLADERSPYLRHAAHQKIDWYPWSDEAFERARAERKPVFLSSGGVWCHWCHVMAEESFEDDEVASLLNELFISVKLDRDERPDIDRRYQQAVASMGSGSGWPLSVFLTPDKRPFFGGTYFPPEDSFGRPGFKKLLRAVRDFYDSKRQDAEQYAAQVMAALKHDGNRPGDIGRPMLQHAVASMLTFYDADNGGFGAAPKFPMPGALEFLIRRSYASRSTVLVGAVQNTLDAMARGGFHDQLGGGFHRYSVDEAWVVPHFEKMADDNAWLLRNYVEGYAVFGDERYREVAEGIIRFAREVLSDPAGGFFASQDADVTPEDEGGYFTWTDADLRRALTDDEYRVLSLHFFSEQGRMHHDPEKRVLSTALSVYDVAERLARSVKDVEEIVRRGKQKLLAERNRRRPPFVDRTLYASLNGMFIASFFKAYRALADPALRHFGLLGLDRILKERLRGDALFHCEGIPAVLDDYVYLVEALVSAFEATGDRDHLIRADELMARCLEKFGDAAGGLFDTEGDVLGTRFKRVEDIPHPSANAVAVLQLLKLSHLLGREEYRREAERTLRLFSPLAAQMGVHAGMYFNALDACFNMLRLTVGVPADSALAQAARALAGPQTAVAYAAGSGHILPCIDRTCFEPVTTPEALREFAGQHRQ